MICSFFTIVHLMWRGFFMVTKIKFLLVFCALTLSTLKGALEADIKNNTTRLAQTAVTEEDKEFLSIGKEEIESLELLSKENSYLKGDLMCARVYSGDTTQLIGLVLFQKVFPLKNILYIIQACVAKNRQGQNIGISLINTLNNTYKPSFMRVLAEEDTVSFYKNLNFKARTTTGMGMEKECGKTTLL